MTKSRKSSQRGEKKLHDSISKEVLLVDSNIQQKITKQIYKQRNKHHKHDKKEQENTTSYHKYCYTNTW